MHRKLVQAKQAADLHTPSFTQRIVYETVKDGFLDTHIPTIRALYGERCKVMLDAMKEHFPAGVTWNEPQGGMFIWVQLPPGLDSFKLLDQAIAQNVAFVPGGPFFANEPQLNTLRLSFVTVPPEKIRRGVAILGKLLREASRADCARRRSCTGRREIPRRDPAVSSGARVPLRHRSLRPGSRRARRGARAAAHRESGA